MTTNDTELSTKSHTRLPKGHFLSTCFEDTGDIKVLLDCADPKRIVLGRTGAGKTALLHRLRKESEFVISVQPEHLSLNYLTNSTILPYLSALGINLDPFYKLLWRHVFAVTIIQHRVDIVDKNKQGSFIEQIKGYFDSRESKAKKQAEVRRSQKALDYLKKWGDRFFEDVEYRTKEVVERFENAIRKEIETKCGGSITLPKAFAHGGVSAKLGKRDTVDDRMSVETTQEIKRRAQCVVNEIQVQELTGIFDLLEEVLNDPQKPCYITIDQLDEPWVDQEIRLRLLKGLVDTVREFQKVHNAKIIISLRVDLIEQVFRATRSEAGFQEDKYRSLYLPLRWTPNQIQHLLDRRVAALIRDAYTNYTPTLADVMPVTLRFGRKRTFSTIEYIIQRTWNRPRDVIAFLNACIQKSEGKGTITKDAILDAEGEYSRSMLRSIGSEWHAQYPLLLDMTKALLTNQSPHFPVSAITKEKLDEWSLETACIEQDTKGDLFSLASDYQSKKLTLDGLRQEIVAILYKTGCVGVKTSPFSKSRWATSESYSVSPAEIDNESAVTIHPGLWRVLGVHDE